MRLSFKSAVFGLLCAGGLVGAAGADVTSIRTPPGGTNGSVQVNKQGGFYGDQNLTYSTTTHQLSAAGLILNNLSPNQCVRTDGNKLFVSSGFDCNIITGVAAPFAVTRDMVLVTSPTAKINFFGGDFLVSGNSSTSTIVLNPSTTDFVHIGTTLQAGSTFYVSSATVVGQLSVGSIKFPDGTIQITSAPASGAGGGSTSYIRSGYSSRFSESVNVLTSSAALDQIFAFQYQSPAVTLATSPGATLTEKGSSFVNVTLSAFTVKKSSPILAVQWKQNSVVIKSSFTPTSTGGLEVYVDTNTRSVTTTYTAAADDGTSITTSNGVTFTFVYPFYYGVGASALTGAQVQALTKLVQTQQNTTTITSPSSQVYYFAYPQAYGVLTSILDTNGFETLSGYTRRTVSLTMLDASSQSYYIYEFNTLTTQTNFHNTYKF